MIVKISLYIFNLVSLITFLASCLIGIQVQGGLISYFLIFLTILFFAILPIDLEYKIKKKIKVNLLDIFVLIYIVWNLFTLINVIIFGDLIIYLKGVSYTIFPISGYFISSFSNLDKYLLNIEGFLQLFFKFLIITIIFGAFHTFARPEYYVQYLVTKIDSPWAAQSPRMISYFGNSSIVGNICAISFPIIFYLNERKKIRGPLFIYVVISLFGLTLSFARGAWVVGLFVLSLLIILKLRIKSTIIYLSGLILIISIVIVFGSTSFYVNELKKKIDYIPDAFAERSDQIKYGLNSVIENVYGMGLGQMGHKSKDIQLDKPGVYDNNYLRIASEIGIPGFFIFFLLSCLSFFYIFDLVVIRKFEKSLVITIGLIIFEFYSQALGTNVFDYFFSSFIFWYLIGALSLIYKVSRRK